MSEPFCLPAWDVSRLYYAGWQPLVEGQTEGGLLVGICVKLQPLVIPVHFALLQMMEDDKDAVFN